MPTFERPRKATSGREDGGKVRNLAEPKRNVGCDEVKKRFA